MCFVCIYVIKSCYLLSFEYSDHVRVPKNITDMMVGGWGVFFFGGFFKETKLLCKAPHLNSGAKQCLPSQIYNSNQQYCESDKYGHTCDDENGNSCKKTF